MDRDARGDRAGLHEQRHAGTNVRREDQLLELSQEQGTTGGRNDAASTAE
jgi:hypothetical protein